MTAGIWIVIAEVHSAPRGLRLKWPAGRLWHAEAAEGWGERREGSGPWLGFSESDHFYREEVHGNAASRLVSKVLRNSGTEVYLLLLP